jgi:hypothetical protein
LRDAADPAPAVRPRWLRVVGWLWVGVSACYALFAFTAAATTAAALAGLTEQASARAAPPLFLAHAVSGGLALVLVSAQLCRPTPPTPRSRRRHRVLGTGYVLATAVTCLLSVPVVVAFRVDTPTKAAFLAEATLWLLTTAIAYADIRAGRVARHREWMIRSFALSAFFVTFSLWDPILAALPLDPATGYRTAVLLAWSLNLLAAEAWIRRTRRHLAWAAPVRPQT